MKKILVFKSDNSIVDYDKEFIQTEKNTRVYYNNILLYIYGTLNETNSTIEEVEEIKNWNFNKFIFVDGEVINTSEEEL